MQGVLTIYPGWLKQLDRPTDRRASHHMMAEGTSGSSSSSSGSLVLEKELTCSVCDML